MKKYRVSYPKLGNYYVPIYNLLNNIIDKENVDIIVPDKMTNDIIQKGANNSPDFICTPFKYNMGNFIDAIEKGANVIIQAGGGCRYGYYYELQEKILKDLGYDVIFINLLDENGLNVLKVYKKIKILNSKLTFKKFCHQFLIGFRMIVLLDKFETYMRENYNLQKDKSDFESISKTMLKEMSSISSMTDFKKLKRKFSDLIYNVPLRKITDEDIKIGIIGELFTSMEPFASLDLEKQLNKLNCNIKRYTTATYLLFQKGFSTKKVLRMAKNYDKYLLGADGSESICRALDLINKNYDGIIHIKPFGCMPEINAMPILQKISQDKKVPIMYLTFDEQTSSAGINTRIEAFYDMIKMKKESKLQDKKVVC